MNTINNLQTKFNNLKSIILNINVENITICEENELEELINNSKKFKLLEQDLKDFDKDNNLIIMQLEKDIDELTIYFNLFN